MRALTLLTILSPSLLSCGGAPSPVAVESLAEPEACFTSITTWLADDARGGRGLGSPGLDEAADGLARLMKELGLKPVSGSYEQRFEVTTGVSLDPSTTLSGPGGAVVAGEGFTPLGFSSSAALGGELVFVGYGVSAPDLGYDDLAGVDLKGKVALALRYEPGMDDPDSPFDGRRPSRYSDIRYKALKAREAGATALILVTGPGSAQEGEPDVLPPLKVDGPTSDAGIPVLQVTRAVATAWVAAGGQDLAALQAKIEERGAPASAPLGVEVQGLVKLTPTRAEARNIVGLLPGSGALADEVVVVGAHYDHLGQGGRGSMRPDEQAIHNGADDNASGVAATLCGVGALTAAPPAGDRRALLVVGFSAEEVGLGGSSYYVDHPLLPLEKTVAMVNLDMVGRVRDGALSALGSDSAPEWADLLTAAATPTGLTLKLGGDGYGPSDHMSFYSRGVPVVHLFSGSHPEYHTPEDDVGTLNPGGGAQVSQLLEGALRALLTQPERLTYTPSTTGPLLAGDSRGYGAYLGTIPDYSAMESTEGGVLLSGVRAGGPAAMAGVQAGDRLVRLAGVELRNLYDMTFALQDHRPGETVELVVVRGGETVTLHATLGKRGAEPTGAHATPTPWAPKAGMPVDHLLDPREKHLSELRQLTFGGENAEAYFSPDGQSLIFQRTPPEGGCDQQLLMDLNTGTITPLSSGKGRTTCGYYSFPDGKRQIYATTEGASAECPPTPDRSQGYVWPLYPSYDLVWQDGPGGAVTPFLPSPGYDAEATVCMKTGRVIFTSTRDGDLELYSANADGSDLKRLTNTPGYDGGAYFTPSCEEIVWRASRPTGDALKDYQRLLKEGLVRPSQLELYMAKADGSEVRQLTQNGAANFGPYPTPDASGVIFSTNVGASPREFDLQLVSRDGGPLTQITFTTGFDGFPMFSPDGRYLVFASNRAGDDGQTNLFIARWTP